MRNLSKSLKKTWVFSSIFHKLEKNIPTQFVKFMEIYELCGVFNFNIFSYFYSKPISFHHNILIV